jgi:hypothetical protein
LGIIAIINDVHLVGFRVPDADLCFAAIHLFYRVEHYCLPGQRCCFQ